jgi:hypothetical protein
MRHWCLLLGLGLILAVGSEAWSQSREKAPADEKRIGELIQKLGSQKFLERENARKELEAIGLPALEALKKAAKSDDLETKMRAGKLVRLLEEKSTTAKILAPRRVRLNLKDTPVLDAVKELEKQSHYSIQIQGDQAVSAKRKVTLDTGDTTFWEALDQLCAKAGLVEARNNQPFPQPFPVPMPPIKIRPIKIQPLPAPGVLPVIPPAGPQKKGPVLRLEAKAAVAQIGVAQAAQAQAAPGQQVQVQVQPAQPVQGKPVQVKPVQVQPIQLPVQIQPIQIQPIRPPMIRPFPGVMNPNQSS